MELSEKDTRLLKSLYKKLIEDDEEADYGDEMADDITDEDFEDLDDSHDVLYGRTFKNNPAAGTVNKALNGTDKESEDELQAEVDAGYFSDQDPNMDTDEAYYDTKDFEHDARKLKTGKGHARAYGSWVGPGMKARNISLDAQIDATGPKKRRHNAINGDQAADNAEYRIEPSFTEPMLGDGISPDVGYAAEDDYLVDPDMKNGDEDRGGNTIKWYD